ncbi:amidohydrolase family protein [Terriglobus aquaticus]|uniref:Amidohydrolase family protein n=1 Tax=Terriglobus aquaticus TaxID=940139 RepID=A0ABW9KGY4_9BACT|nr:amidohydrolase family protein [Terriglobus aquaticus]
MIDGDGTPPRANMDVLVEGERIVRVFPDVDLDPHLLSTAKVVPLAGRFVIPGLIDAHVHLATPPNRRQAEAVLRRDLYGGVTAVRDMADDLRAVGDLARASLVGEIPAPDIYYAALMAGPDFFTDKRTIQVSAGGQPGRVPWMQAITATTDLPLAVAEARGTYANAIKLYGDLTPELAARITAEAHRQGLQVWAHATLYPARPSEVVAAGVDAISHACLLVREPETHSLRWTDPHPPPNFAAFREGKNPALAALFTEMKRRGTVLDATVWAYSPDADDSGTSPPLPPSTCNDVLGGAITGQAYRAGVLIDAGTDNVSPASDPWPDLFHELSELKDKADMPPAAVLQSATSIAARATGQSDQMGSIAPGKLANMVVLSRDPLLDLDNLKSVVITVKRGRVFERSAYVPLQQGDITDH